MSKFERLARVRARGEFLTFANTAPPIGLQIKIN
ncbi:unknown [Firmicutes bacterium CAG:94]|nr:unknown [Firmicutes bacterium CAG:94]